MDELANAVNMAFEKFKEEFGKDAKLQDGESFITVFNNASLVISLDGEHLKTEFIGGKPFEVDMTLSIYEE